MTLNNSYLEVYSEGKKMTKTCVNCGTGLNQDDQFCSSCGVKQGKAQEAYTPYSKVPPMYAIEETKGYIKLLGLVELAFGIVTLFGIAIATLVMSFFLSPEFFQNVGAEMPTSINFGFITTLIWGLLLLVGISGIIDIIGGILLLQQKKSGKIFTYISAVFSLVNVPIGTLYAIGAFWILSKPETDQILR
jgi:hypothetical protein